MYTLAHPAALIGGHKISANHSYDLAFAAIEEIMSFGDTECPWP